MIFAGHIETIVLEGIVELLETGGFDTPFATVQGCSTTGYE